MLHFYSKKCFSNIFLIFICVILLASCATPRPILRITPKETDKIRYWQGKEIVTMQNDSVKIILSYDRQNNYSVGDFSGCEVSSIQSLNYYKNSGNKLRDYDAYNLIGVSSNVKNVKVGISLNIVID